MTSRFNRLLNLRVLRRRGELLFRLALPPTRSLPVRLARELIVVTSPTVPYLRS